MKMNHRGRVAILVACVGVVALMITAAVPANRFLSKHIAIEVEDRVVKIIPTNEKPTMELQYTQSLYGGKQIELYQITENKFKLTGMLFPNHDSLQYYDQATTGELTFRNDGTIFLEKNHSPELTKVDFRNPRFSNLILEINQEKYNLSSLARRGEVITLTVNGRSIPKEARR